MTHQHHLPSAFWLMPTYLSGWAGTGGRAMPPAARGAVCTGLEIASLASRRMQAYAELPSTVAMCKGPGELVAAQLQFWRTAMGDYAECNRRIATAWSTMADVGEPERADQERRDYITFPEPEANGRHEPDRKASRRAA